MDYLLLPIAFLTSALAATIGMGGGVLLLACMPGLVPAAALLPLHAATQLASNASRAFFDWRLIQWSLIPPVALGAVTGALLGGEVYRGIPLDWLPPLIGLFILLMTWTPLPLLSGGGRGSLFLLGFYQTGLGMIAGATGPLGASVLLRRNRQRDWLVVNTAVYMSLNHGVRLTAFLLLGFSLAAWWQLLAGMVVAVFAGSWLGTRLRRRVRQRDFSFWFKLLLTVLALRMLGLPWLGN